MRRLVSLLTKQVLKRRKLFRMLVYLDYFQSAAGGLNSKTIIVDSPKDPLFSTTSTENGYNLQSQARHSST